LFFILFKLKFSQDSKSSMSGKGESVDGVKWEKLGRKCCVLTCLLTHLAWQVI